MQTMHSAVTRKKEMKIMDFKLCTINVKPEEKTLECGI